MAGPRGFYLWEVRGFPEDFPERLERLKRASGLSWRQIAYWLGTDTSVIREWRAGRRQPSTVHLFSLFALASTVYGCCGILLGGAVVEDRDVAGHPS